MQALETHRSHHKYTHWFDAKTRGKIIFPTWKALGEILCAIQQAPLRLHERLACYAGIVPWLRRKRRDMTIDLTTACGMLWGRLFSAN